MRENSIIFIEDAMRRVTARPRNLEPGDLYSIVATCTRWFMYSVLLIDLVWSFDLVWFYLILSGTEPRRKHGTKGPASDLTRRWAFDLLILLILIGRWFLDTLCCGADGKVSIMKTNLADVVSSNLFLIGFVGLMYVSIFIIFALIVFGFVGTFLWPLLFVSSEVGSVKRLKVLHRSHLSR